MNMLEETIIKCVVATNQTYVDALKAQGIAAYTFALYKSELSGKDYDITADYKVDQCYLTDDELKEKWGEKYSENKKRLETIANTISGEWLSYDGKPILAVYHAVSAGMTYSCKDVWGKDLPYLKSVDSSYDKLSDNYQSILEFSFADFYGRTEIESKDKSAPEIKINTDKFGRVTEISDFCERLELNSQNFSIETKEEKVVATVRGRGHGVGMSQEGANYLAKSGSSYKEILHHYYQGCRIER